MGNCCTSRRQYKKKIVLLLVGLDNAGKTVAVKGLAGENTENSVPSVGFSIINLKYLDYNVSIYDLGGGSNIRGIWHRYFVDVHGIIFVIDASDYDRFDEVKQVLQELLSHEKISGKPLLILANKQDNKEALDEIDIVEKLDLENLVNEKKCPTLIESCSAKEMNQQNKIDASIKRGYHWILNYIIKNFENLNKRVELDVKIQKEIDEKQRKEKIERLKIDKQIETEIQTESEPIKSPSSSVKSTSSCGYFRKTNIKPDIETNRPKSAIQLVRNHLEKSNRRNSLLSKSNKTSPIILLSPKSAPTVRTVQENEFFRVPSQNGQILTVTELPNAIIDSNGENIGDLFELNNFSSVTKLPPLRPKPENNFPWYNKPPKNKVGVMQNNIDEIYKDIS